MTEQEKRIDLSQSAHDFAAQLDKESGEIVAREVDRQKRAENIAQPTGQAALEGFTINDYHKFYLGNLVSMPRQRSSVRR